MAFVPRSYKATPCRFLQPLWCFFFFPKGLCWQLWSAMFCSWNWREVVQEWNAVPFSRGDGQSSRCCPLAAVAPFPSGEANGSHGAER